MRRQLLSPSKLEVCEARLCLSATSPFIPTALVGEVDSGATDRDDYIIVEYWDDLIGNSGNLQNDRTSSEDGTLTVPSDFDSVDGEFDILEKDEYIVSEILGDVFNDEIIWWDSEFDFTDAHDWFFDWDDSYGIPGSVVDLGDDYVVIEYLGDVFEESDFEFTDADFSSFDVYGDDFYYEDDWYFEELIAGAVVDLVLVDTATGAVIPGEVVFYDGIDSDELTADLIAEAEGLLNEFVLDIFPDTQASFTFGNGEDAELFTDGDYGVGVGGNEELTFVTFEVGADVFGDGSAVINGVILDSIEIADSFEASNPILPFDDTTFGTTIDAAPFDQGIVESTASPNSSDGFFDLPVDVHSESITELFEDESGLLSETDDTKIRPSSVLRPENALALVGIDGARVPHRKSDIESILRNVTNRSLRNQEARRQLENLKALRPDVSVGSSEAQPLIEHQRVNPASKASRYQHAVSRQSEQLRTDSYQADSIDYRLNRNSSRVARLTSRAVDDNGAMESGYVQTLLALEHPSLSMRLSELPDIDSDVFGEDATQDRPTYAQMASAGGTVLISGAAGVQFTQRRGWSVFWRIVRRVLGRV